jgi:sugar phosphate isomerase/epimerase
MPDTCIAAQMFTIRKQCQTASDLAASAAKVKQIGYGAVQVSGIGKDIDPAEVARILKGEGLICAATHVRFEALLENFEAEVEKHRLWECDHPAIGSMPKPMRNPEGVLEFARQADEVGRKLVEAGFADFSYHNHDFEFQKTGGVTWLELIYENTDPKHLAAELDTHWVQAGGGDPAAWIERLAGRTSVLHLKDYARGPEGRQFAEVGAGNLNWKAILAAARKAGVQWYCVEQDDCYGRDPFESLKISYENLREMGLE